MQVPATTAQSTIRSAETSPRFKARLAAVLYLFEGTGAVFGHFVILNQFVVSGDATATATRILANQPLFWMGFAASLLAVAFHLAYTILFYDLFAPVNRSFSLLTAFVSVIACTLQAISSLFQLAPMLVLGGGSYLNVFKVEQLRALALLFLNLNKQSFGIYLIFFAFWLIMIGYLIFRSTFMPRIIGVLLILSGLGYMVLLAPPIEAALFPYYLAPDTIGEPLLLIWFLVVGVNVQRWREQVALRGAGGSERS